MEVAFTAAEREVARFDVALGPTAPLAGRKRPLVSQWYQRGGLPDEWRSLQLLLSPDAKSDALTLIRQVGGGRLYTVDRSLVEPLAQLARDVRAKEKGDPTISAPFDRLADRWIPKLAKAQQGWPVGVSLRISGAAHVALRSLERGQAMYVWFGPGRPWTLTPEAEARLIESIRTPGVG